jgi:hypothetical protein
MKECPQCKTAYAGDEQSFCGNDGTPLVDVEVPAAEPGSFLTSLPISPSEIVLLNGDQFAPELVGGAFQLVLQVPTTGKLVDAVQLTKMMLSAMVLCTAKAGASYLQTAPAPRLSMRDERIFVSSGPATVSWPQGSLEDRFCAMLRRDATAPLSTLICELWDRMFSSNIAASYAHGRTLVLQGLAARNLIKATANFSSCQVLQSLTEIPADQSTEPLKALFTRVSSERQSLWVALQGDIQAAMSSEGRSGPRNRRKW